MRELSIAEMKIPAGGESEGDYGVTQQVAYGASSQWEAFFTERRLDIIDPFGIVDRPSYIDTGVQCQPITSPLNGIFGDGSGENSSEGSMSSAGDGFGGSTSGETGFC